MKIRVTIDEQAFDVEVGDLKARPIPVTVDGESFMVWPEEQAQPSGNGGAPVQAAAAPASKPSLPASTASGKSTVTAPIPGVIISLAVKEGDSVSAGQDLCILEAMKMKNSIRASRAGKITAVRVAAGDQVRRGQVMLEIGD